MNRLISLALRLLPALLLSTSCVAATAATPAIDPRISSLDSIQCANLKNTHVMRTGAPVDCSQLQVVHFSFVDLDGQLHDDGEVMVMAAVAPEVLTIFTLLLARHFPLAGARLMNHYQGNDDAAMADNNTSAFNHRPITGGGAPSLHAYGLAIDVNPLENPYVRRAKNGILQVSPPAGKPYTSRLPLRPGMVDDRVVEIFAMHGFPIWGGDWHQPIDYQHFQVSRKTAEHLSKLRIKEARVYFENSIEMYQRCLVRNRKMSDAKRFCALAE